MSDEPFTFPLEIKDAVRGLNNNIRWEIIESLVRNGEMSYTNLMQDVSLKNKGIMNFHLKKLSNSALIARHEILGKSSGERVFYNVSPFGDRFLKGLMSALTPPPSPQPVPIISDIISFTSPYSNRSIEVQTETAKKSNESEILAVAPITAN